MPERTIGARTVEDFDLQRRVFAHMTSAAWRSTPHVSYVYEPDVTEFHAAFQTLAAQRRADAKDPRKISFNAIMLKALVEGLIAAPALNALIQYEPSAGTARVELCSDVNISMPWLLADGRTITPIIAQAQHMSVDDIADATAVLARKIANTNVDELLLETISAKTIEDLKRFRLGVLWRVLVSLLRGGGTERLRGEARTRYYAMPETERLTKSDLLGGTVTISNVGSLYPRQRGFLALLEIIPPQVLAIGIGAVQDTPGVFADAVGERQIGIRKVIPICLAFDHRALDFAALVPFLERLDGIFAKPDEIFTW